MAAAGGS
ncbi:hypothetical protein E2C01_064647 [Portunus trituberculatus]|nr:hypothetical protein [Portunus trituberculatus]